ncbi:hypothetical protein OG890_10155 [Streptomyces anulatus]|nr:hypothetical protein [Streptomyces anulatus]MCX4484311.1 hypothetical protein [Streptomyces anulatus]MCX4517973.1 hypothetical protein [Streptomyces anulatus]MCX4600804.1 hypothetical protein [Streptomyces anulatus]WTD09529.1 hypothetical protein OHA54_09850 [Streptomyces anulatus]
MADSERIAACKGNFQPGAGDSSEEPAAIQPGKAEIYWTGRNPATYNQLVHGEELYMDLKRVVVTFEPFT